MTNKTILIIGATGTIGCYTALYFKEQGYAVVDSGKRSSDNVFFKANGIDFVSLNISNKSQFDRLNHFKIDAILHCGGAMPGAMYGYYPQMFIDAIITGPFNVLECA